MTTNEIAEQNDSSLELLPRAQAPSSAAQAMLLVHAEMMQTAFQLASKMCRTSVVPRRYFGKADDATAAILYGAELGLNPIQSLQKVVAIHGMPSLESRTMVGLLKAKGFRVRTVEQSDTSVTVEGVAPDGEMASSTWTIDRAKRAGYVPTPSSPDSLCRPDVDDDWVTVTKTWDGKPKKSVVGNMKYITDPQTMLKAKAQAEVCRELAPDVLMGISYSREELESEDQRQFDRMDARGAAPARATAAPVTEDEIFAEEVPLSSDGIAGVNPPTAEQVAHAQGQAMAEADQRRAERDGDAAPAPEPVATETPAGDVTEDQGNAAPDPQPSPAAAEPGPAPINPAAEPAIAEAEAAARKPAKKAPAKKAPPRNVSKLRAPLEKRLFALLDDAGLAGDKDRDGRIAVYRSITGRPDIASTNDMDDVTVGKVCDQLWKWSQANELDDQIAGILADAAREAEETSAATVADPTSEGTE